MTVAAVKVGAWVLLPVAVAALWLGCPSPRASGSARVVRSDGAGGEHMLVARVSRPILERSAVRTIALPDARECSLQVSFANLETVQVLVFLADAVSADGETRLISSTAMPGSGWHDETVRLPPGARELRLTIEGDARERGVWSRPVVTCMTAQAPAPNVLVISLDTLRADRLEACGGPPALMPNLNDFASRSTVFTDAYSQYPQTLGSHATLFTSLYPSEHGAVLKVQGQQYSQRLAPGVQTLASVFARNGYATVAFSEDAYVGSAFGFDSGFDLYHDGPPVRLGGGFPGDAAETFGRAERWLHEQSGAPFFMFLHTYQVHTPYAPPPEYLDAVLAARPGIEADGRKPVYDEVQSFAHNKGVGVLDRATVEWAETLYDAEAAYLDSALGALLARLAELGLMKNTIVVILSDHGEEFAEHGLMGHGHDLHEEVLRVPLLLHEPGGRAGATVRGPVGLIDVGPTLLELAGISDGLRRASGRSLVAAMRGQAGAGPRPVYSEMNASYVACPATQRTMENCRRDLAGARDGAFSYMVDLTTGVQRLYSMTDDRAEQYDLSAQRPDLLRAYRESIDRFREAAAPASQAGAPAAVDPEAESRLKALGYLQ